MVYYIYCSFTWISHPECDHSNNKTLSYYDESSKNTIPRKQFRINITQKCFFPRVRKFYFFLEITQ